MSFPILLHTLTVNNVRRSTSLFFPGRAFGNTGNCRMCCQVWSWCCSNGPWRSCGAIWIIIWCRRWVHSPILKESLLIYGSKEFRHRLLLQMTYMNAIRSTISLKYTVSKYILASASYQFDNSFQLYNGWCLYIICPNQWNMMELWPMWSQRIQSSLGSAILGNIWYMIANCSLKTHMTATHLYVIWR